MNKERRKNLGEAISLLCSAQESIERAKEIVEDVRDEEQESYDNLPESLQESERGEAMQENIDNLESVSGELDDIFDNVETQIEEIQNVIDS